MEHKPSLSQPFSDEREGDSWFRASWELRPDHARVGGLAPAELEGSAEPIEEVEEEREREGGCQTCCTEVLRELVRATVGCPLALKERKKERAGGNETGRTCAGYGACPDSAE